MVIKWLFRKHFNDKVVTVEKTMAKKNRLWLKHYVYGSFKIYKKFVLLFFRLLPLSPCLSFARLLLDESVFHRKLRR